MVGKLVEPIWTRILHRGPRAGSEPDFAVVSRGPESEEGDVSREGESKGRRWEDPMHFEDRGAFRLWLERNHDRVEELWIGFYRKATGKGGIRYDEVVDECLCWGWIDGMRRKVDDERYTNRLTPRRERSRWSRKNLQRFAELEREGRIAEPGRRARRRYEGPEGEAEGVDRPAKLPGELLERFRAEPEAWAFHRDQPARYRATARRWILSAKRDATRRRRLEKLIRFAAAGERLPELLGRPARHDP
jgi:uncharacterized protein YdeI (YjbR/CyaY-like superfamily)